MACVFSDIGFNIRAAVSDNSCSQHYIFQSHIPQPPQAAFGNGQDRSGLCRGDQQRLNAFGVRCRPRANRKARQGGGRLHIPFLSRHMRIGIVHVQRLSISVGFQLFYFDRFSFCCGIWAMRCCFCGKPPCGLCASRLRKNIARIAASRDGRLLKRVKVMVKSRIKNTENLGMRKLRSLAHPACE